MCFCVWSIARYFSFFFFNDTATTEIYPLSLHDALPISVIVAGAVRPVHAVGGGPWARRGSVRPMPVASVADAGDRKSTRLNSSHLVISDAVFCLKKKKKAKVINYDVYKALKMIVDGQRT